MSTPIDPSSPDATDAVPLIRGRSLPASLLQFSFARSGGPGGQNVNKLATKAQLRIHLADLVPVLGPDAVLRLRQIAGSYLTDNLEILITDSTTRSQHTNRQACIQRLRALLIAALTPPRIRRATKPTRGSHLRRIASKKHHGSLKATRRGPADADHL